MAVGKGQYFVSELTGAVYQVTGIQDTMAVMKGYGMELGGEIIKNARLNAPVLGISQMVTDLENPNRWTKLESGFTVRGAQR